MARTIENTEVVIVEDKENELAYLMSLVRRLRLSQHGGKKFNPVPKGYQQAIAAKKEVSAHWGTLADTAGCFVLDIDFGPGSRRAGIELMDEISRHAQVPIIIVTGNRTANNDLQVEGLAPFFIIDKPIAGLPSEFPATLSAELAAFNDTLGQAVVSACFVRNRLRAASKRGSKETAGNADTHSVTLKVLSEVQAHPTLTLVTLMLLAIISVGLAVWSLAHSGALDLVPHSRHNLSQEAPTKK